MREAEYDRMYRHEDGYWWFVSRRELVLDVIGRLQLPDRPVLLDVGCGTGATAEALGRFGRVVGVDMSAQALAHCRARGLDRLTRGQAEALPLADESIDVIVATDMLEHIDDDVAGLREFLRVLKPGGHAVVTVPAYQFLWSEHDVALMHRRRYVARMLADRSREAGFRVMRLTYAFHLLFPLALARLLRRKPRPGRAAEATLAPLPPLVNSALIHLQRLEAAILRRVDLPWGLSVLAVIRKEDRGAPASSLKSDRGAMIAATP